MLLLLHCWVPFPSGLQGMGQLFPGEYEPVASCEVLRWHAYNVWPALCSLIINSNKLANHNDNTLRHYMWDSTMLQCWTPAILSLPLKHHHWRHRRADCCTDLPECKHHHRTCFLEPTSVTECKSLRVMSENTVLMSPPMILVNWQVWKHYSMLSLDSFQSVLLISSRIVEFLVSVSLNQWPCPDQSNQKLMGVQTGDFKSHSHRHFHSDLQPWWKPLFNTHSARPALWNTRVLSWDKCTGKCVDVGIVFHRAAIYMSLSWIPSANCHIEASGSPITKNPI